MNPQSETLAALTTIDQCEPCQTSVPPMAQNIEGNGSSQSTSLLNYPTEQPPASAVAARVEERPTQEPLSQLTGQQQTVSAGWQTDKKVLGLWSACSDQRNAWMYVDGIGWRKFADNSDSAIMAFNIIASHAKVTGKGSYFYEGNDGKVSTLYVW
ncbi:hypothetical protein [Calothrix sp. NIES-2098]|uniref:hypothetical protein n=1 Tax=Calothrix sp. NIES-2098 TaxID=1954171 RepID=UPI000B61BBCF|nr:putative secreted metalloprotease [Calothrix sp. NIES-2098]